MSLTLISVLAAVTLTAGAGNTMQGGAKAPAACALLSAADLAKLTGRPELAKSRQIAGNGDEPGATNCGYLGTSLQTEVQPLPSAASFNAAAERLVKAGEFQPFKGPGDAAWFRINKIASQYGIVVRVGATMLTVAMDMKETGPADKARAMLLPIAEHMTRGLPR